MKAKYTCPNCQFSGEYETFPKHVGLLECRTCKAVFSPAEGTPSANPLRAVPKPPPVEPFAGASISPQEQDAALSWQDEMMKKGFSLCKLNGDGIDSDDAETFIKVFTALLVNTTSLQWLTGIKEAHHKNKAQYMQALRTGHDRAFYEKWLNETMNQINYVNEEIRVVQENIKILEQAIATG